MAEAREFEDKEHDLPMKDSGSSPVGARSDDSTLFSLDALKKTDDARAKEKSRDDSGVIDLKALAAMGNEERPKHDVPVSAMVAPTDLFAVSAPLAPMTAPVVTTAAPRAPGTKPNRMPLWVAAGAVVALAAGGGVFVATRRAKPATANGAATATAVAPPPATTSAAPPPPEPEEAPKAAAVNPGERPAPPDPKPTAAPAASSAAAAAPPAKPVAVAAAPRSAPRAAPKEDAPPKPPVDACDLTCQMKKAVGKKK
jgi:hypothetical protein